MEKNAKIRLIICGLMLLFIATFVYGFSSILMPFFIGGIAAFFLDPVADKLEARGLSRVLSVSIISLGFLLTTLILILLVGPVLFKQIALFVKSAPDAVLTLKNHSSSFFFSVMDYIKSNEYLPDNLILHFETMAKNSLLDHIPEGSSLVSGTFSFGFAFIDMASMLILTPYVCFVLLLEWDRLTVFVKHGFPKKLQSPVTRLGKRLNIALQGWAKGQAVVCLCLAVVYSIGLSVVGMQYGLLVGLISGFVSFVPILGVAVSAILGITVAVLQWGFDLPQILLVGVVFVIGQILEGYWFTPKFVGNATGLHPLVIVFSLMAFGSAFGFAGILIAIPATAVIAVFVDELWKWIKQTEAWSEDV